METVIDGAVNFLYISEACLTGFSPGDTYVLRFTKKGCKDYYFKATSSICECIVTLRFCIVNCIGEAGMWQVDILTDVQPIADREKIHNIKVFINK